MRVIEDINMLEDGAPYAVNRTWKARLLSLPWTPLRKWKTIVPRVPRKDVLKLPDGTIVGHPETLRSIRLNLP